MADRGVLPIDADLDADRSVLGGKAWGIRRMLGLGVPVPPAFVITTDVCARVRAAGGRLPDDVRAALPEGIAHLERATGRVFGADERPLLVSVRSGAAVSMPGMMDTVLNVGTVERSIEALARETGDAAFAADTRQRFDRQYEAVIGRVPPSDPSEQLVEAVTAVFASWNSTRAVAYRRGRGLDDDAGTAVTVQAMVFGNLDDRSGTGVLFTRDPLTGAPEPFGEWLPRAQGEDVVAGTHDPLPLAALATAQPEVHAELMEIAARLEQDGRDVQDLEFTVESGRLWLLQSRSAKRSPQAAVRLAVALAREGLIERGEALDRVEPEQASAILRPYIEPRARAAASVLAAGRSACPGVVSGTVVTSTEEAFDRAAAGERIVLARQTTDPEDVPAMAAVSAILTELGGATSHAAVVSRELGVPCVVGCGTGSVMGLEGRRVTVDATSGEVLDGELPVGSADAASDPDLLELAAWAREDLGPDVDGPLPALLAQRRSAAIDARR